MNSVDFSVPQRQSKAGILLIFATAVFHLVRNFWFLGVYFFVQDVSPRTWFFTIVGLVSLLSLTLIYSIFAYLKFLFYIDREKEEFILQKGVFSSDVVSIPFGKIQQVHFKRSILQRFIGVYSLLIDTAGSKGEEVEINALTKLQADSLAETLLEVSASEKRNTTPPEATPKETGGNTSSWVYKLSTLNLLKLGLTSNYLRGLALLVAFYFSLKEQLGYNDSIEIHETLVLEVLSTSLLFLLLFFVGMLITVIEVFIKYYNLKVSRTGTGLNVEMGLKENTRVSIRPQRVQLLQIATNPLQKRLDLHKMKISLASSQDDLTKDQIQIPGLPGRVVEEIDEYLYSSTRAEIYKILPHKLVLMRRISRGLFPIVIGSAFVFFGWVPLSWNWILGAFSVYFLLMITFQVLYYNSLKLSVSNNFLVKESGVWIRKQQILEMYKLQAVSVTEPVWYKGRKLVNLIFHTAGGDVSFGLVKKTEVLPLLNYLMYKIEATPKTWM